MPPNFSCLHVTYGLYARLVEFERNRLRVSRGFPFLDLRSLLAPAICACGSLRRPAPPQSSNPPPSPSLIPPFFENQRQSATPKGRARDNSLPASPVLPPTLLQKISGPEVLPSTTPNASLPEVTPHPHTPMALLLTMSVAARSSHRAFHLPLRLGLVFSTSRVDPSPSRPSPSPSPPSPKPPPAPTPPSKLALLAPGVALSMGTSFLAFASADYLGAALLQAQSVDMSQVTTAVSPISGVPISILLGIILNNAFPHLINDKSVFAPGLKYCSTTILRLGIVCVGVKLSLPSILQTSLTTLPVVVASVASGLFFIPKVAHLFGLPPTQGRLLSAGTSICGVTAITALAPGLSASPRDVSVAVANVVFWGTAGMLLYPHLLHEFVADGTAAGSNMVGVLLGVGIHDTSQVLGAAKTYSELFSDEAVLKAAAITKLSRNLSLAFVIPGLTYMHVLEKRKEGVGNVESETTMSGLATFQKYVPSFLLGFVGMSAARSAGDWSILESGHAFALLDQSTYKALIKAIGDDASKACLGTAMASVGLATSKTVLEGVGPAPFIVGGIGSCIVGGTGVLVSKLVM